MLCQFGPLKEVSENKSESAKQKSKERTFELREEHERHLHLPNFSVSLILKHIILINWLVHVKSLRVISVNSKLVD